MEHFRRCVYCGRYTLVLVFSILFVLSVAYRTALHLKLPASPTGVLDTLRHWWIFATS